MQQPGSLASVFAALYACARARGCDHNIACLLLQTLRRSWVFASVWQWHKREKHRYFGYQMRVRPYGIVLRHVHLGAFWAFDMVDQRLTWLLWQHLMQPFALHRMLKKIALR